jgi:hypothetical protein
MKLKAVALILTLSAFPVMAFAQATDTTSTKRIDKRQEYQGERIDKGAQSGQLTGKEKARLEKGQGRVQKAEDKAMADGKMTKKERARIEHMQDHQSKNIYREKHDKQKAK